MLRRGLRFLSESQGLRSVVVRGPLTRPMSRRFVAGETLDEFVQAARAIRDDGFRVTANFLGESVTEADQARVASDHLQSLIVRLGAEGLDANVSVKLSQLGMDVDADGFRRNLDNVLERADREGTFIRFDMESSAYTVRTLELFEDLWKGGRREIGIVLQAQLHRTAGDVRRMIELGAPVRLCKGAYAEPRRIAFTDAREIRRSFREAAEWLLLEGHRPAIATHDESLIRSTIELATRRGIDPGHFEFQFLHGVRRDLQRELLGRGYRVRIYLPYGDNWYPYLVRRLAERPENVMMVVGSVLRESPMGPLLPGERGIGRPDR
jgi:proline dehydrogenase